MTKIIPEYIKNHLALDDLTSSLPLLRLIDEQGAVSQADAANFVGLARGTCNLHFQKLEHMGLIHRTDWIPAKRGRSTIMWELEKGRACCWCLTLPSSTALWLTSDPKQSKAELLATET